jgi:hypothetical protein
LNHAIHLLQFMKRIYIYLLVLMASNAAGQQITWADTDIDLGVNTNVYNATFSNQGSNNSNVDVSLSPSSALVTNLRAYEFTNGTLRLLMNLGLNHTSADFSTLSINFSKPYCGLSFRIQAILTDLAGNTKDLIEISATNAKGPSPVIATMAVGAGNPVLGSNTIESGPDQQPNSVNVSFPDNCISGITFKYSNPLPSNATDPTNQAVQITNFNTVLTVPFPLSLTDFKSFQDGPQIALNWASVNEQNFYGFNLERSFDGLQFENIGEIKEPIEVLNNKKLYAFRDINPKSGQNYYRLKMIDTDGSEAYSAIISQNYVLDKFTIKPFPNPVLINEALKLGESQKIKELKIFDNLGRPAQYSVNGNGIYFNQAGKYYLNMIDEKGSTLNTKIIVK